MRVLITGATGFAGGHLAWEIARNDPGAEIWGTAHTATPNTAEPGSGLPASAHLAQGDITDSGFVRDVIRESMPDRIYHLAGFASAAGTDREKIFRVNVAATVGLLEELRAAERECHVLLASSGYVYGATEPGRPARETDPLAPMGAYAKSKAAMEAAVAPFSHPGGLLRLTAVRSFNHTGPRQNTEFVVPAFARQIARIEAGLEPPVVRVGNLDSRRDFLDVRDVVRAYRLLSEAPAAATGQGDADGGCLCTVNVCSGKAVTIRSILDELVAGSRVEVTVELDPDRMRPSDLPESAGDPSFLSEATGWGPQISLETTIADTLDWWRSIVRRDASALD